MSSNFLTTMNPLDWNLEGKFLALAQNTLKTCEKLPLPFILFFSDSTNIGAKLLRGRVRNYIALSEERMASMYKANKAHEFKSKLLVTPIFSVFILLGTTGYSAQADEKR